MARKQSKGVGGRIRSEGERIQKEVRDVLERSSVFKSTEKRVTNIEKNLEKNFQTFLKNLNIPTRKEMEGLEKKIERLQKELDKATGKGLKKAAKKTTKKKAAKK